MRRTFILFDAAPSALIVTHICVKDDGGITQMVMGHVMREHES